MLYTVEGCGPDQEIEADTAEEAAQEAANWQHERHVEIEWTGTGPDTAIAEYQIVGTHGISGRITVRRAT